MSFDASRSFHDIICVCSNFLELNLIKNQQVNISLWTRFQLVFDMHVNSLRNANIRSLWEDDVHLHYVIKSSVEFTSSLGHLNVEYGDGYNLVVTNYILSLLPISEICSVFLHNIIWFSLYDFYHCSLIRTLKHYEWQLMTCLLSLPKISQSRSCRPYSW